MDEQTPTTRITRGIDLHEQITDESSSFCLGLIQDLGDIVGSIARSLATVKFVQDEQIEVRSKHKHDPKKMQEIIKKTVSKVVKSVQLKKKIDVEARSSKKRKASQIDPKCSNPNNDDRISDTISQNQSQESQLTSMQRCHVQAQLFKCFMIRELRESSTDAFLLHPSSAQGQDNERNQPSDSDSDFQDPPLKNNNKGKEKILSDSSPTGDLSLFALSLCSNNTKKGQDACHGLPIDSHMQPDVMDYQSQHDKAPSMIVSTDSNLEPKITTSQFELPSLNPERIIMLHSQIVMSDHTPLPTHRIRRPGLHTSLPYITSFGFETGSSSKLPAIFKLKHSFIQMSDEQDTTIYMNF